MINFEEFEALMLKLSHSWTTQNTELALSCFTGNAIYMEPPNIQLYKGHQELKPYFDALTEGFYMIFHNLMFNAKSQVGAGEYSFGVKGKEICDTGIVVVEIKNQRIDFWREYQQKGPSNFDEFIGLENKEWQWHIGNYP